MWEGKDDMENFKEHVTPLIEQLCSLEGGYDVSELLEPLPPVLIERGAEECGVDLHNPPPARARKEKSTDGQAAVVTGKPDKHDPSCRVGKKTANRVRSDGLGQGKQVYLRMRDLRGPKGAKGEGGQLDRLALVNAVRMFPSLMVCLDGGTWASASGVSVASKERNNFLNNLTRYEHRRPYRWAWLEDGDTVPAWCERKQPKDKAFLEAAMMGLSHADNAELAHLTRHQPRGRW